MTRDVDDAAAAAEEVRDATRRVASAARRGLRGPAEVYAVLGPLVEAAAVLAEVTEQLAGFLDHELQSGQIGLDPPSSWPARIPDPLAEVAKATAALDDAHQHAERLASALDTARETTSRMHRSGHGEVG